MTLHLIILIFGVAFVLYVLLGGADFGGGIVEIFAGRKGEHTVSKAMAPVWEANHVWLILAIVILFSGFPAVYATLSTALHIPLTLSLLGIVLRGCSFTFRHYDIATGTVHRTYTLFFRISSLLTPFFFGITLGAMMLGAITNDHTLSFADQFLWPWLNVFSFAMGVFTVVLFGYIAAIFLIGEATYPVEEQRFKILARRFLLATVITGLLVFIIAELSGHHLTGEFVQSPLSITCLALATLGIPFTLKLFHHTNKTLLRIAAGVQVTLILMGWFAIQFPVLVYARDGQHLTFYNTHAPEATLDQLLIALIAGLCLVGPAFYFLFRVFKKVGRIENTDHPLHN